MTAAYRLKGIGWFAVLVGVVLGFYLISLQVAAERKKLDDANLRIAGAERDIRALETEFDTRANLVQLEKWNGDTLALVAPTAAQFVPDDTALASLNPDGAGAPAVRTAALVVPAFTAALAPVATPAPVPVTAPPPAPMHASVTPAPVAPARATSSPASAHIRARVEAPSRVRLATAAPAKASVAAQAARVVVPSGRAAPAIARLAEAARGEAAVAKVRPQAVALLDRKLLSDTTFGDILSGARAEASRRR